MKNEALRILRYFFVGGTSAVVDIGLFSIFASFLGWPWLPVSIVTFLIGTSINYFLSIHFVFESGVRYGKHHEILGVFIVSGLALIANQIILYLSIEILHWHLIFSKCVATGLVFFLELFWQNLRSSPLRLP